MIFAKNNLHFFRSCRRRPLGLILVMAAFVCGTLGCAASDPMPPPIVRAVGAVEGGTADADAGDLVVLVNGVKWDGNSDLDGNFFRVVGD